MFVVGGAFLFCCCFKGILRALVHMFVCLFVIHLFICLFILMVVVVVFVFEFLNGIMRIFVRSFLSFVHMSICLSIFVAVVRCCAFIPVVVYLPAF